MVGDEISDLALRAGEQARAAAGKLKLTKHAAGAPMEARVMTVRGHLCEGSRFAGCDVPPCSSCAMLLSWPPPAASSTAGQARLGRVVGRRHHAWCLSTFVHRSSSLKKKCGMKRREERQPGNGRTKRRLSVQEEVQKQA